MMHDFDSRYRLASGLDDRRFYKIFYSHVHPFPLLVLGQNPGGETDGTDMAASDSFFENWEHDYVCFRHTADYALARPMCELLSQALDTRSIDALRQVPASNMVFRRSRNTAKLNVSMPAAAKEAKPFIAELIQFVNPRCILLISKTAYDLFVRYQCRIGSVVEDANSKITTPNGASNACIHLQASGYVEALGRDMPLLMVGHPSKYSSRTEWPSVVAGLRAALEKLSISPIEGTEALVNIPRISAYGAAL